MKGYLTVNLFICLFAFQADLLDAAAGIHIRFRMGGVSLAVDETFIFYHSLLLISVWFSSGGEKFEV